VWARERERDLSVVIITEVVNIVSAVDAFEGFFSRSVT
jgi:hypothetical protein